MSDFWEAYKHPLVANRRIATKQVAQALDLIDGIEPT